MQVGYGSDEGLISHTCIELWITILGKKRSLYILVCTILRIYCRSINKIWTKT